MPIPETYSGKKDESKKPMPRNWETRATEQEVSESLENVKRKWLEIGRNIQQDDLPKFISDITDDAHAIGKAEGELIPLDEHLLIQFLTGWGINNAAKLGKSICQRFGKQGKKEGE